jgi:hypothetical protein
VSPLLLEDKEFPLDKVEAKHIPRELNDVSEMFTAYYMEKHPKTKLMLLAGVSQVECKLNIPRNAKCQQPRTDTLTMELTCASVLASVDEKTAAGGITFRELVEKIGDRNGVRQYLPRLCSTSHPILKRSSTASKIDDSVIFHLNLGFDSQGNRVVIPAIEANRAETKKVVVEKVEVDKVLSIKGAVVRILKMKNRLEQTELEGEVIRALAPFFRAEVATIRKVLTEVEDENFCIRMREGGQTIFTYMS